MKKKLLIILILIISMVISFYAMDYHPLKLLGPRSWSYIGTKSISLIGEDIDGLALGTDIKSNEFISKYGMHPPKDHDNTSYSYYRLANGLLIATEIGDSRIIRIRADSSEQPTSRNITVGDKIDKAISAYGNHFYRRTEQGADIIGYIDKASSETIEFWYHANIIVSIRYDNSNME